MALDVTLVQVLKHRERYDRLYKYIPEEVIDPITRTVLRGYGKWFEAHPERDQVDIDAFRTWIKLATPNVREEKLQLLDTQLRQAAKEPDPEVEASLHDQITEARAAVEVAGLLEKYDRGDEIDFPSVLRGIQDNLEAQLLRKVKLPWVDVEIEELLDEDQNDTGLHWRLDCINESLRPLRAGDFGIIAARVDAGKTSFIADNLTFMAPQLPEGRGIAWFNNEGPGRRIVGRLWQSALNMTFEEMQALRKKGKLRQAYAAKVGGSDRIKVYDVHDWNSAEVEDIIRKTNPGLVVMDMIDNIKFSGMTAHEGSRTDQVLESMYQWARICAVKYDCPILATSQLSGDAEGLTYPSQAMLKDSKTGKQGAAEFILVIGKSNDPLMRNSRFLSAPKNKLARPGGPPLRVEVEFDGARGKYRMPE